MTEQKFGMKDGKSGLHLVQRAVRAEEQVKAERAGRVELPAKVERPLEVVREGTTGRVVTLVPRSGGGRPVLRRVWAVAEEECPPPGQAAGAPAGVPAGAPAAQAPEVEVAFYRKYTEAMLRRYVRLSMSAGRVPSLLGRELFRGNVTSYRVQNFEDVVIFCHDMEKCLGRLEGMERELVKRVGLQQYTQGEAAGALGISLRNCLTQYGRALDRLTRMLLEAKMLEPLKSCQEERPRAASASA